MKGDSVTDIDYAETLLLVFAIAYLVAVVFLMGAGLSVIW
jgi:hypothetical protein